MKPKKTKKTKKIKKIKVLFILIIILTIALIIFFVKRNNNSNTNTEESSPDEIVEDVENIYSQPLSEDTMINNSEKISETRTIDGIELSSLQIIKKDNVTKLAAIATNTSDKDTEGFLVNITLLNVKGNEIGIMKDVYIQPIKAGESVQIGVSGMFGDEYVNAYDLTITKK